MFDDRRPSSLLRRGAALLIDNILFIPVWFLLLFSQFFAYFVGFQGRNPVGYGVLGAAVVALPLLPNVYWVLFWSRIGSGRTLGMRAMGIRVVTGDGEAPSVKAAFVRCLVAWCVGLPGAFILVGLGTALLQLAHVPQLGAVLQMAMVASWVGMAATLFAYPHRGLHDRVAGTTVVYDDLRRGSVSGITTGADR